MKKNILNYKGFVISKVAENYLVVLRFGFRPARFPSLKSAKAAVDTTVMAIKNGAVI